MECAERFCRYMHAFFSTFYFFRIVILNSFEAIRDAYREDGFAGKPTSYLMQLRSQGKYGSEIDHQTVF